MSKFFLILAPFMLGFLITKAEERSNAEDGQDAPDNSLLWKISGNGLKTPSFLFGTIHMICPDDYTWTNAMDDAFKSSKQVVMELDMDDPNLQMEMSKEMMLDSGKTLRDFFTEAEYNKLNQFSKDSLGLPLEMFSRMEPFTLLSMFMMKTVSCGMPDSYEGNLVKMARAQEKEVLGLESVSAQMAIFENMDSGTVKDYLLDMVDDWKGTKDQYAQMVTAYKEQNIKKLHDLVAESPEVAGQIDAFLYNRNQDWIPLIEKMANDMSSFFAVGAGHLSGERGVIKLLKDAGYTVEPLH